MFDSVFVLKMKVSVCNKKSVLNEIVQLSNKNTGAYICISNVHMCMEAFDSYLFEELVNNANLVIPDGRPIFWAQRLLGKKAAEHVRGEDITHSICEYSHKYTLRIGLYGGSNTSVLFNVIAKLKSVYPNISITYFYSPPFRPLTTQEDIEVIQEINASKVNVLLVGIGCPKQEKWMAEHKDQLNCVMLGVGAAFDFIAGTKKQAPKVMQKLGLEWLFRLSSEPKRLWKRYLIQNPRFLFYFSKQLVLERKNLK